MVVSFGHIKGYDSNIDNNYADLRLFGATADGATDSGFSKLSTKEQMCKSWREALKEAVKLEMGRPRTYWFKPHFPHTSSSFLKKAGKTLKWQK